MTNIFQRGGPTTNQMMYGYVCKKDLEAQVQGISSFWVVVFDKGEIQLSSHGSTKVTKLLGVADQYVSRVTPQKFDLYN